MDEQDWLAKRFEENRTYLRAVAYRMLGSHSEADDAVQEAWLRLSGPTPATWRTWVVGDDSRREGVSGHAALAQSTARGALGHPSAPPGCQPRPGASPGLARSGRHHP